MTVQEQSPPADTKRTEQGAPGAADEGPELKKSLKSRHMTMISLGGVIGAGLFVGSSAVIAADVMNAIVVTAVLSCLNSGMYTARGCCSPSRAAATRRRACSTSTGAASP